jgi:HAD superfamily hydrolase (TIGR01509 family)
MVHGVILDMDGTLVDTNEAHAQTWVDALQAHGYAVTREIIRPLIGLGGDKMLPRLTGQTKDSELGQKISEDRSARFEKDFLPSVKPFANVGELLDRMHDVGLTVFIASSSKRDHLEALVEKAGIADRIDGMVSASDVEASKPDPDVIEAALAKLGMPASEAIMIGDTPYDIEAAARVGVRTIAFRSGGWTDAGLTGAVAVYADAANLLAQFDTSPLAQ